MGTPLILRAGRYTGGCEYPVCQGLGKVLRLEACLGGDDRISWDQSYAYADSGTDLPLLKQVGHPVAVYPDEDLTVCAQHWGWEVMGHGL